MSESDEESKEVFVRRHKTNLRRAASFKRLQDLPQMVDDWFHGDGDLHAEWDGFAARHKSRSAVFSQQPSANGGSSMIESDHTAKAVHIDFCDRFESQLEVFLQRNGFSSPEFQEAFRIAKDEEERNGTNFYRWPDVVEFETFLSLMRGGAKALLAEVSRLASDAQREYRRRVAIFPLTIKCQPTSFADVTAALQTAQAKVPLNLNKSELRELARWRAKLQEQKLNADGVYAAPPRDEAEWARYLTFAVKQLNQQELDQFCSAFLAHFQAQRSANQAPLPEEALRYQLLSTFDALDDRHRGSLELEFAVGVIAKADVCRVKQLRKLEVKYRLLHKQTQLDKQRVGIQDDAANEDGDANIRLPFEQGLAFLREATQSEDEATTVQKLKTIEETARDRC